MHIRKQYDSMHIYRSIYFIHLEFIWYNIIQQVSKEKNRRERVGARIQNNLERANFSWARVTGSVDDFFELAKL